MRMSEYLSPNSFILYVITMLATDNAILKRFEKWLEKNRPERFDILPILEWRFDAYHSDEEFQ